MAELITPPPELIEQWMQSHSTKYDLARQAAQWGAAAALRAAATQLHHDPKQSHQIGGIIASRFQLLAIAAELDNNATH
jgi:hypothetical protein